MRNHTKHDNFKAINMFKEKIKRASIEGVMISLIGFDLDLVDQNMEMI